MVLAALIISCDNDLVYDKTLEVNDNAWHRSEVLEFEVDIEDSLRLYNIAINLRNTIDYPYSNTYLFVKTIYPDGSITRRDTVECVLAYPDGSWTGHGGRRIRDNRFWFTEPIVFPLKGRYRFEIEQGNKDTIIQGIKNVGLHIEYRKH